MSDTLLDHIRREAFPQVVRTGTKECGCFYETYNTGDVRLSHCSRHLPESPEDLKGLAEIISLAIERFREDGDEESTSEGERRLKELRNDL